MLFGKYDTHIFHLNVNAIQPNRQDKQNPKQNKINSKCWVVQMTHPIHSMLNEIRIMKYHISVRMNTLRGVICRCLLHFKKIYMCRKENNFGCDLKQRALLQHIIIVL